MTIRGNAENIVDRLIEKLGLQPLSGEGGYFSKVYRSPIEIPVRREPAAPSVTRSLGSSIYYLITPDDFSSLHRLKSDEIFHFYLGDPAEMIQISESGEKKTILLGPDVLHGQQVQVVVPADTWQGTRLVDGGKYALFGTTVVPGFEYADFELGVRTDLISRFPHVEPEIIRFTRERQP